LDYGSSDDEEIEIQRTHCDDGDDEEPSSHIAAFNGILWRVERRLNDGVSIETTDSTRSTALHIAAMSGNEQLVQLLLDKGANLEAKDSNMRTALHHAAAYKRNAVVRLLLDKGANLEAIDKGEHTPLHRADIRHSSAQLREDMRMLYGCFLIGERVSLQ
jgi:ankyrin repeat protein